MRQKYALEVSPGRRPPLAGKLWQLFQCEPFRLFPRNAETCQEQFNDIGTGVTPSLVPLRNIVGDREIQKRQGLSGEPRLIPAAIAISEA